MVDNFGSLEKKFRSYSWHDGQQNVNPGFYRSLNQMPKGMRENFSVDKIVIDPSVIVQSLENTVWKTDFFIEDDLSVLEEVYGEDIGLRYVHGDEPRFQDIETSTDIYQSLEKLSGEAEIYCPDHMENCLSGKRHELEREAKNSMEALEAWDVMEEVDQMRDDIVSTIRSETVPLEVTRRMKLPNYTRKDFEYAWPEKTEDDFIIEAARELEPEPVIMTYDTDFINSDLAAYTPTILSYLNK